MIKETIDMLLKDEESTDTLKDICNSIKAGDYMELRSDAFNLFWTKKTITDQTNKQKAREVIDQQVSSKRLKSQKRLEEKDAKLLDSTESVSSIIKNGAIEAYNRKVYKSLDNCTKNIICNGLNSVLDLSDQTKEGQRRLFNKKQWYHLQDKYNKYHQAWRELDEDIKNELKSIEKMAMDNIKGAYNQCLKKQAEYTFSEKEKYFECYAFILRIIQYNPNLLIHDNDRNKELTEEDYVVKVWAPIFESFFRDTRIILKWGESASDDSTSIKKSCGNVGSSKMVVGDKVDLRMISEADHDVLNAEFASHSGDAKYGKDHRKLLRESKNIGDYIYKSKFIRKSYKNDLKTRCIQIAATEGEIIETILVDDGLYVGKKIGSLRLPSGLADLKNLRVLFERLNEIKRGTVHLSQLHSIILKNQLLLKKSLDRKRDSSVSPYSNDADKENKNAKVNETKYVNWTRGSWFPPSETKDTTFTGDLPKYFLSPLPSEN